MDATTAQLLQTVAAVVTAGAAVVTGGFLVWYTIETYKLRKSAQIQAEKTSKLLDEAQRQNEQSLLPIVSLNFDYRTKELMIRNIGNGPAFNVWVNGIAKSYTETICFDHPTSLASGESHIVQVGLWDGQRNPFPLVEMVGWIWAARQCDNEIRYTGATGNHYATHVTFYPAEPMSISVYFKNQTNRTDEALVEGVMPDNPDEANPE